MWHCPNCGERIDDVFDACWQCGTAQDGIPAAGLQKDSRESDTRASHDPGHSHGATDDPLAAQNDVIHGRIVELCSTTNVIAAYAFCDLLADAGIQSRIVGEFLASAAGSLPLGETIAPRVWVREKDATRAREIIDPWMRQPYQEPNARAECNEPTEPISESDEESHCLAPPIRFRRLGQGLVIVGGVCIACGAVWATLSWTMMRQYSGTTRGVLVGYGSRLRVYTPPPPEIPLPREPVTVSVIYKARYAFVVKGVTYHTKDADYAQLLRYVTIYYDPQHPATNFAGSLASPRSIIAWALGTGGFILLLGFYLCVNRQWKPVAG